MYFYTFLFNVIICIHDDGYHNKINADCIVNESNETLVFLNVFKHNKYINLNILYCFDLNHTYK